MVTLKQIAVRANVSEATVSRALRDDKSISEATRRRIQALAREMGHSGNRLARALALKRTHTVGLVISRSPNAWFRDLSWAISERFSQSGYSCIAPLCERIEAVRYLAGSMVDALVIWGGGMMSRASSHERKFLESVFRSVPTVCIASDLSDAGIPSVDVDRYRILDDVVDRLASMGHRRILFAADTLARSGTIPQKVHGYQMAMKKRGLTPLFAHCPGTQAAAYERTEAILKQKPTAVIAERTEITLGFAVGCIKHGVHIPDDISLIGYDNMLHADGFTSEITTIGPDANEVADAVVRILLDIIEGRSCHKNESGRSCRALIPHRWREGGSIAPPRR